MNNVKAAIYALWFLFTLVIGSYYFVLTNNVQNLERELAQINNDIKNDIRDIHVLEADWSELNNPERLQKLAGKYISLDFIKPEQIINYSALPLVGESFQNPTMYAKDTRVLRKLANSER